MKNGRDEDYDDPKITSLSAARKKAAADKKRAAGGIAGSSRSLTDWIIGLSIIAMAAGFLIYVTMPLWQAAVSLGK